MDDHLRAIVPGRTHGRLERRRAIVTV